MTNETVNAQIKETMLGIEDHGIMTFMLYLDYGDSSHQGFGGYTLDQHNKELKRREGDARSIMLIRKILEVVDVDKWEKLRGKYIRVRRDGDGMSAFCKIIAIGHPIKNQWLYMEDFFESDN